MATANEFSLWFNGVPVMDLAGDGEFNEWDNLVPLVDVDESNPDAQPRRRAHIE